MQNKLLATFYGLMSEWFKVSVSKADGVKASAGSNPAQAANSQFGYAV